MTEGEYDRIRNQVWFATSLVDALNVFQRACDELNFAYENEGGISRLRLPNGTIFRQWNTHCKDSVQKMEIAEGVDKMLGQEKHKYFDDWRIRL